MADLYELSKRKILSNEKYTKLMSERGVKYIEYYTSPDLRYPTDEEIATLDLIAVSWKIGDTFAKFAYNYYNTYDDWWIISYFNKMPSEYELRVGDLIYIPMPRDEVFRMMNGRNYT